MNKNPISQDFVDSALGRELRDKGIIAIGVSFLLVILFMLVYYRFAGVIACIALLMNLLFLAAICCFYQATADAYWLGRDCTDRWDEC